MFPSDVLNLDNWILQDADKDNKNMQFITDLKDYHDTSFYIADGSVAFKTNSDGPHTTNSEHPRTELACKTTFASSHSAELDFTFTNKTQTTIPICVAQIKVTNPGIEAQLLATGSSSTFRLVLRHFDNKHSDLGTYTYNSPINVVISVLKGAVKVHVTQDSKSVHDASFTPHAFNGAKFKVGNYFQSTAKDKSSSIIEVSKLRTAFHL